MFRIVKVNGDSMQPCYRHNDYVVVMSPGKKSLAPGQDVVCRHPQFGNILKRIDTIKSERLYLTGLNPMSTSKADLGFITRKDVVGRVIYHFQQ